MADRFTPLGSRLLKAYENKGILSKKIIAESLGFKSEAAVYKVINGERELGFDSLRRFVETTGNTVEWLLDGTEAAQLEDGEVPIYFGPKEHEIIQKLAGQSKRTFEDEVRELVLEKLEDRGLVTTKAGESNLIFFGDAVPRMVDLPYLGEIAAGEPLEIVASNEKISVPDFAQKRGRKYMVLRVRGDSMIDNSMPDGSLIVCEVASTAKPGETVVAVIDGNYATVKKYYPERGRIRLQPANPAHEPQYVSDDRLKIQGIVVVIFHRPQ